jgi:AraC-like DNA-binding protein
VIDASGPSIFLVFMISKHWLEERSHARGRSFRFVSPRVPIDAAMRQSCWRVLHMVLTANEPRAAVDDEVERLLAAAVDATMAPQQPAGTLMPPPSLDHRLRAAIACMREHAAEKITIDQIAARIGTSRATVFSLSKEQLNTTPQVFLSAVRVEEAMRRVGDGEAMTAVAILRHGVADEKTFDDRRKVVGVFKAVLAPRRLVELLLWTGVVTQMQRRPSIS